MKRDLAPGCEAVPVPGTVRIADGPAAGLPAALDCDLPVEADCRCGGVIRRETWVPVGAAGEWRHVAGMQLMATDAGELTALFARWAEREGILARITEEQYADLAKAFMAGYAHGLRGNAEQPGRILAAAVDAYNRRMAEINHREDPDST